MTPLNGYFLVLEGTDGAGKTTLTAELVAELRVRTGREVVALREPGGTPEGEAIRNIVKNPVMQMPSDGPWSLLMFSAARRALMQQQVEPALARGAIVIVDRFILSSLLYQGAQGVSHEDILAVTKLVVARWPDETLVLSVDPQELTRRLKTREGTLEAADAYEQGASSVDRQEAYIALAQEMAGCTVLPIAAGETPLDITERVIQMLAPALRRRGIVVSEKRTHRQAGSHRIIR